MTFLFSCYIFLNRILSEFSEEADKECLNINSLFQNN